MKRDQNEARLAVLRQAFQGSPWEAGLTKIADSLKPKRLRSIVFRAAGKVDCVTSRSKNRDSYHLAALISHFVQMKDRGSSLLSPRKARREAGCEPEWV